MQTTESHAQKSIMNWLNEGRSWLIVCSGVVIAAAISRFLFLADKPYHHDESLHAYYSLNVSRGSPHEYSALLHGPVLYYLVGAFMAIFGADDFLARFPAALCNVALVILPLFWHRSIGKVAALAISLFLLLSPTFMYFGRFLREDAFNSLWIGCSLASFFAYHWWGKPWHAVCASAFLAMQFCNKENSYLHLLVWLAGAFVVLKLIKRDGLENMEDLRGRRVALSSTSDRIALILNCVSVFVVIFVLFYSSFFRHSKGALHGILDGLYRESLLYWWEQNKQRRIDGPFDYHFPLLFNYEFALLPVLLTAWIRTVSGACRRAAHQSLRFPNVIFRDAKKVYFFALILLGLLMLPRVGLTREGCEYSELCASTFVSESLAAKFTSLAKLLHINHTRNLIQIIAIAVLGAIALLGSARTRRFLDGFLWWWATGMLGIYSYVGEKVPWLLIYILLPLVVLAGLEVGRLLGGSSGLTHVVTGAFASDEADAVVQADVAFNSRHLRWVLPVTLVALTFATWKAIRLSFVDPAGPEERLIFTQTTPMVKNLRSRWVETRAQKGTAPKVTMAGDATWPMAWYAHDLPGAEYIRPADAKAADAFDAFFLDASELAVARKEFPHFDIYELPLRHWWVPKPNPRIDEIFEYFLTRAPYPRELRNSPLEQGFGHAAVLYLENKSPGKFFADVAPCACGERIQVAQFSEVQPQDGVLKQSEHPSERKN